MSKKVFILINCDTDPVVEPNCNNKLDKGLLWQETIQRIIGLRENLSQSEDSYGTNPRITWYLRSDEQSFKIWGDWCYSVNKYKHIWNKFKNSGDNIGWHPHLWRYDKASNKWYQEIKDMEWVSYCLNLGYEKISKLFDIKTTRMGWCFHDNNTMSLLDALGILYDLSAIPGLVRTNDNWNIYDWSETSSHPYRPSRNNYIKSDENPNNNLNIIEIPITTFRLPPYLRLFTKKDQMAVNLAKNPVFYRSLFTKIDNGNDNCLLNVYFHPSDLGKGCLFSIENFISNLFFLTRHRKIEVIFTTPNKFIDHLSEDYEI